MISADMDVVLEELEKNFPGASAVTGAVPFAKAFMELERQVPLMTRARWAVNRKLGAFHWRVRGLGKFLVGLEYIKESVDMFMQKPVAERTVFFGGAIKGKWFVVELVDDNFVRTNRLWERK